MPKRQLDSVVPGDKERRQVRKKSSSNNRHREDDVPEAANVRLESRQLAPAAGGSLGRGRPPPPGRVALAAEDDEDDEEDEEDEDNVDEAEEEEGDSSGGEEDIDAVDAQVRLRMKFQQNHHDFGM